MQPDLLINQFIFIEITAVLQQLSYRFLSEVPALEVLFKLKTNVASTFDAAEMLDALYGSIQQGLLPETAIIDLNTLTIENERLNGQTNNRNTQLI